MSLNKFEKFSFLNRFDHLYLSGMISKEEWIEKTKPIEESLGIDDSSKDPTSSSNPEANLRDNVINNLLGSFSRILNCYQDIEDIICDYKLCASEKLTLIRDKNNSIGQICSEVLPG